MLWLPIVVSAVVVFVISSIFHMVSPHHRSDYKGLPDEQKLLDALTANGLGPGEYFFPYCGSMKEASTPEFRAKLEQGPSGSLIVQPAGGLNMGKSLLAWFVFSLFVSGIVAYLSWITLGPGADGGMVFRVTATAALLGYGFSMFTVSMWKGLPWSIALKFLFDEVCYALATGAVFLWLWPAT